MTTELELDHLFWNEICRNIAFQSWFVERTKFAKLALDLVTEEQWHQRWYRDPVTHKDSETDILLLFKNQARDDRYAIHIENKPAHRIWEPLQAENYRKRAMNRMAKWRYVDFQIALIAPSSFIARSPREVDQFDIALSYEDISVFIPEFRHA